MVYLIPEIYLIYFFLEHFQEDCYATFTKKYQRNFNLNGVPKTYLQKRSTFMQELQNKTITVKTTRHRNIFKIIFEVNVRPVIQLVYMKKETKTRERRKDEKVTKQLMKFEMKLYLVI